MSWWVLIVVAVGIGAPHVVGLDRAVPAVAATVWLSALVLRALTAVAGAVLVVVGLPTTQLFALVTHWCWHVVLPLMAAHLGLNGHAVGDLATAAPLVLVSVAVASVVFGLWRGGRAVGRLLARAEPRLGPQGSVLIPSGDLLVAAAGLRQPRIVVSAGALAALDDDELAASLDHERGHIARHHRFAFLLGELCRALARPLPGTRYAARELAFHLERDADRFAVMARRRSRLALASALCKAGCRSVGSTASVSALTGSGVVRRVEQLLDARPHDEGLAVRTRALAAAMVVLTLTVGAALPPLAVATAQRDAAAEVLRHCPS